MCVGVDMKVYKKDTCMCVYKTLLKYDSYDKRYELSTCLFWIL